MKGFLTLVSLLISGVLSEAPYPPSGWRPSGPTLELPERTPLDPRNRTPQKQEYLPPGDSRTPDQQYGTPDVDVSVQGLPTQEQLPIFQLSPVNGQQYVGPNFNADLRTLEENYRRSQLQAQQEIYREFARQRQLEAALANGQGNQPIPRSFVPRTTTTTQKPDDLKTTLSETTTEALNQGEVIDDKSKKDKVTVEVSKQNIQEYPPELFLNPLAQLRLQQQFSPVQLGQLRAPIFLEPSQTSQKQVEAIQAILAQQQLLQLQQSQLLQQQAQPVPQQLAEQPQYVAVPANQYPQNTQYQPTVQYQTSNNQYETVQPVQPVQPAVQAFPQTAQPVYLQPQANQLLPRPQEQPQQEPQGPQPQIIYYQPEYQQPINQYQPEYQQPLNQYQPLNSYQQQLQPQLFIDPSYQQQIAQQGQDNLQSGLDVNGQGNGVDQNNESDDDETTATAVATAFGARTQPRVYNTYGAPVPVPRVQANPGYQTTTEAAQDEPVTDNAQAVAEANAFARGERRRPAKLRSRPSRVRPIFTLDKSGHLVLAQE